MKLIKPLYDKYDYGKGPKFERVDNKVSQMLIDNPKGFALKGKKETFLKYKIDPLSYDKSLERIKEVNPRTDFSKFEFPSREQLIINKKNLRVNNLIKDIKKFKSKEEAITASGLSKSQFNKILRENDLNSSDLGLKVGKGGNAKSREEKNIILNNFLRANSHKKFTRSQLAEAVGMPKTYVKDTRLFKSSEPNLVSFQRLKLVEFDQKIIEMNKLISDIQLNKINPNMGEEYYRNNGYKLPQNLTKNYLEFPEKGSQYKLAISKNELSKMIGKKRSN